MTLSPLQTPWTRPRVYLFSQHHQQSHWCSDKVKIWVSGNIKEINLLQYEYDLYLQAESYITSSLDRELKSAHILKQIYYKTIILRTPHLQPGCNPYHTSLSGEMTYSESYKKDLWQKSISSDYIVFKFILRLRRCWPRDLLEQWSVPAPSDEWCHWAAFSPSLSVILAHCYQNRILQFL